jgi:DNA-binding CsgD family transcriptional regulator
MESGAPAAAPSRPSVRPMRSTTEATATAPYARAEVLLIDPGGDAPWRWPAQITTTIAEALDRGRRVRLLFGRWPAAMPARRLARHVIDGGAEVRTGGAPDQAMMAVDGAVLLPSDSSLTLVAQPEVARLIRGFAELTWSRSAADGVIQRQDVEQRDVDTAHRSLQRRIVQLLADGAKDETIARVMGMSVRTCRRHIADIMRRLDAVSRFQAGANAVRFGLTGVDAAPRRSM